MVGWSHSVMLRRAPAVWMLLASLVMNVLEAACFRPRVAPYQDKTIFRTALRAHPDLHGEARVRLQQTLQTVLPRLSPPDQALRDGRWFKLICGASYQDLPRIRSLALVYTLAGADCLDVSANEAVVTAAREGMNDGLLLAEALGYRLRRPWVMVSVNDQEDLHFRKASFDSTQCPADCPRPCETVCPTQAISFSDADAAAILTTLRPHIDALEIHTNSTTITGEQGQGRQGVEEDPFASLWGRIHAEASTLRAVSVSFPYMGEEGTPAFLRHRSTLLADAGTELRIWQTDGRPMSGDIGRGTTLTAVRFGESVLDSRSLDFGRGGDFVQLAGGTNAYTAEKLREKGLLRVKEGEGNVGRSVSGLAFGGYARKVVTEVMERWGLDGDQEDDKRLEDHPQALTEAVEAAAGLVGGIKGYWGDAPPVAKVESPRTA